MSIAFVMMACRSIPQSSIGYSPNMLVTGKENNMSCDLIYGTSTSGDHLCNYSCYCIYVEDLKNNLVRA